MDFDPNEAIKLLVSNAARSQKHFHTSAKYVFVNFRRDLFSEKSLDMVRMAGSLAAVKYLNKREREPIPTSAERAPSATELQRFLKDPIYRKLFGEAVADYGRWTDLVLMLEEI